MQLKNLLILVFLCSRCVTPSTDHLLPRQFFAEQRLTIHLPQERVLLAQVMHREASTAMVFLDAATGRPLVKLQGSSGEPTAQWFTAETPHGHERILFRAVREFFLYAQTKTIFKSSDGIIFTPGPFFFGTPPCQFPQDLSVILPKNSPKVTIHTLKMDCEVSGGK